MKQLVAGNLARYRKGLNISQEALAELVGVTRQSINNYETAKTLPDSKTLSALARALGVKLDDLLRPESETLPNFRFRAHASFDKNPQFAALVLGLLEDYTALEQGLGIPTYAPESTPYHRLEGNEQSIAHIANQFRHRLGLGDGPILNLFTAVEAIGLKVLRWDIPIPEFFGLSACSLNQGAFVLVNTHNINIERQLFTLAHEIGHLILHRDDYEDRLISQETKREETAREAVANYFASHLLVSQDALNRAVYELPNLIDLKAHFRVSYTMMLMRLEQMGKLNYGDAIQKIRGKYKRHYGQSLPKNQEIEPALSESDFPLNQRFHQLIWKALEAGKVSELKAAELLHLNITDMRQLRQKNHIYALEAIC